MKKMIALLLALTMLLMCAGCGAKEPQAPNIKELTPQTLSGLWKAEVNLGDTVNELLATSIPGLDFLLGAFTITLDLDFSGDSFRISVNTKAAEQAFDNLLDEIYNFLVMALENELMSKLMDAAAQELGLDMSLEDMLKEDGTSLEQIWEDTEESIRSSFSISDLAENLAQEGTYKIQGDQVLLYDETGGDAFAVLQLESGCLTVVEYLTDVELAATALQTTQFRKQ